MNDEVFCHDGIVSTQPIPDDHSFYIIPNPADDEINVGIDGIAFERNEWFLVDILGRKIKSGTLENHSGTQRIEVADVPTGIYYFLSNNFSSAISIQRI
ncbi:MAG: T9SS type A sorting domain-containing protein [Saprospiraceae bacterium]